MSSEPSQPNATLELLYTRSSCRSFEDRDIPADLLNQVLQAGVHAPSGGNLQPWSIITVRNPPTRKRLQELNENQAFVGTAPVDLIFCIDWFRLERWARLLHAPFTATQSFRHFWISFQDAIIAAQNVCTAADALGLGSVYVGTVLECFRELRDLLQLPRGVFPVVLVSLGWPKHRPSPRPKLGLAAVVHSERYHQPPDHELIAAFEGKFGSPQIEINAKRLDRIERVCRAAGGSDFAREVLDSITATGSINAAQGYFALHYDADIMPLGNDEFVAITEEFGFEWFRKWAPRED